MSPRRMASGILVALGGVLIIFCVCFVVFRLIPPRGKMVQTGDGANPEFKPET